MKPFNCKNVESSTRWIYVSDLSAVIVDPELVGVSWTAAGAQRILPLGTQADKGLGMGGKEEAENCQINSGHFGLILIN